VGYIYNKTPVKLATVSRLVVTAGLTFYGTGTFLWHDTDTMVFQLTLELDCAREGRRSVVCG